ncbi:MAG: ABC transporter substrate-binding protein [Bacilli bacterium]
MKTNRILFSLLSSILLITGCQIVESPFSSDTEEIIDLIDRKVEINAGSYQRIVCIGAGALRLYSYIGNVSLLCGIEDIDNTSLVNRPKMFDSVARPYLMANEKEFQSLPSCGVGGPNAQSAEAEKILSCNPDIVISEYEDSDKENALQKQLGVPVITVSYGTNGVFDNKFKTSLSLLGKIFDEETRSETLINFIESQKNQISEKTSEINDSSRKNAYICGLGNWGTTNHLMTAQNYEPFNLAKINNVISGLPTDGVQAIEKEKFVTVGKEADVMIIDSAAVKNIKPLWQEDKTLFDSFKAWKDGNVYLEMAYNAYHNNAEIALANSWFIAKAVYPELFSDIDIKSKTNEITSIFLGKELSDEILACVNSYGGYQKIDTETFFME